MHTFGRSQITGSQFGTNRLGLNMEYWVSFFPSAAFSMFLIFTSFCFSPFVTGIGLFLFIYIYHLLVRYSITQGA